MTREVEESTVLALGARGKLRGAAFALTGRTCVKSDGGGLWNEWVVAFDDGRQAFLAEAMGAFTLYEERPLLPASLESVVVGGPLDTGFAVVERGHGKRVARWGAAPEAPKTYRYLDLSSRDGESATLDLGAGGSAFVGRKVRLSDLGLAPRAGRARFPSAPGGPVPKGVSLWLAIGDEAKGVRELEGVRWRVAGIVHRSVRVEGERYTWEEYLLHEPAIGVRWLVVSDGHWNVVETVEVGQVAESPEKSATYDGETYRFFSSGKARVEWADGELPWAIEVGDTAQVRDYARAPHMLSREATDDEITWSRGRYLAPDVVQRAFDKRVLPKPSGRAPNQPPKPRP